jgi:hypothetical protein
MKSKCSYWFSGLPHQQTDQIKCSAEPTPHAQPNQFLPKQSLICSHLRKSRAVSIDRLPSHVPLPRQDLNLPETAKNRTHALRPFTLAWDGATPAASKLANSRTPPLLHHFCTAWCYGADEPPHARDTPGCPSLGGGGCVDKADQFVAKNDAGVVGFMRGIL